MNLLHTILSKLADNYFDKNSDAIFTAMQKVNEGGNEDDIDIIVEDYFYLLKSVLRKRKPGHVKVSKNDYYVLTVDGEEYDFDSLIRHNDQKNTERKMEISVLFSETVSENEVEKRLNEKIEQEW